MCLLVVCHHAGRLDPLRLASVSKTLSNVIDAARVDRRPVAYIQKRQGVGFDGLGVRIGRYEPVFGTSETEDILPDGLIDFILSTSDSRISLAGFADWAKFEEFRTVLTNAGLRASIDDAAISPSD